MRAAVTSTLRATSIRLRLLCAAFVIVVLWCIVYASDVRLPPSLPQWDTASLRDGLISLNPVTPSDRPLVLYVYSDTSVWQDATPRQNLEFFLAKGLHARADFVFVFNGETDATALVPALPNVRIVQRDNTCYDLGTYGVVLREGDLWRKYNRFILLNASVRGPFLPTWSDACWTDVFVGMLTDRVKLAGTSVNCRPSPHVQSMVLATDSTGLSLLLDSALGVCHAEYMDAREGELEITKTIKSHGYDADAMMTSLSAEPDFDAYCRAFEADPEQSENVDVLRPDAYFGANMHPYELILFKTGRHITPTLMDRLTQWHLAQNKTSWDVCGGRRTARDVSGAGGMSH